VLFRDCDTCFMIMTHGEINIYKKKFVLLFTPFPTQPSHCALSTAITACSQSNTSQNNTIIVYHIWTKVLKYVTLLLQQGVRPNQRQKSWRILSSIWCNSYRNPCNFYYKTPWTWPQNWPKRVGVKNRSHIWITATQVCICWFYARIINLLQFNILNT
jgi:hypothetical protein